jgi:hypothetical protein
MHRQLSVALLLGIGVMGVSELRQHANATRSIEAVSLSPSVAGGERQGRPSAGVTASLSPASSGQESVPEVRATPARQASTSQPQYPKSPMVTWQEAEAFLAQIDNEPDVFSGHDPERFNAVIGEIARITRGLPSESRQHFKDRLLTIINGKSALPPLSDELYEFEKE